VGNRVCIGKPIVYWGAWRHSDNST
jgi:hypothetical protein